MVAAFILTGVWGAVSSRSLEKRSPSDFAGYRHAHSFTPGASSTEQSPFAWCLAVGSGKCRNTRQPGPSCGLPDVS